MSNLLEKISSYNIFNYLLPGALFAFIGARVTHYSLMQADLVAAAFVYYFMGLVISRIGSLLLEPVLKKIGFVNFADYGTYVVASKKDATLEVLSEVNNTYRTLCSLLLSIGSLKIYEIAEMHFNFPSGTDFTVLVVGLLILFLFSYRKQTSYITRRVHAVK